MVEKSLLRFVTEPLLAQDCVRAEKALARSFDDVELSRAGDGTTILLRSDLMPDDAEFEVNNVLFGLHLPAAQRVRS